MKIEVEGLNELRRGLRAVEAGWPRRVRDLHKDVADFVAGRADAAAPARAKGVIRGMGNQRAAVIRIRARRGDELAVFLGMRRRSGWYAAGRYRTSVGRQFEPWLGQSWDFGDLYHVGGAIDRALEDVEDRYLDVLEDLARIAFPDN